MIGFLVFGLAVGADADDDRIELLLSSVKGKDITELIASGREKLASVPSGGGVAVASGGAPAAASGGAAPAAEAKKEEKVEEKEESDDVSAIFLFHFLYLWNWFLSGFCSVGIKFFDWLDILLLLLQDMGFSLFD